MASKPSSQPEWATDSGRTVEPSAGEKGTGWEGNNKPPARKMNWLFNLAYQWIQYLSDGVFVADASSGDEGIDATGDGAAAGVKGTGGATNGNGVEGQGTGTGDGVSGTGGATGAGVVGTGGASGGVGVAGTGTGFDTGVTGTGGSSGGIGVEGSGGTDSSGVEGTGDGIGSGVVGEGGTSNGTGVEGTGGGSYGGGVIGTGGNTGGVGVSGIGGGTGAGVSGTGGATGAGVTGTGGSTSGAGVQGTGGGSSGAGVQGTGGAGGPGVKGVGGSGNADGGEFIGTGTGAAVDATGADGPAVHAKGDTTSPLAPSLIIGAQDDVPSSIATEGSVAVVKTALRVADGSAYRKVPVLRGSQAATDEITYASADFSTQVTLPANMLRAGDVVKIRATINSKTGTGSGSSTSVTIYIGSTVIGTASRTGILTGDTWHFDCSLSVWTAGGPGTGARRGIHIFDPASGTTVVDVVSNVGVTPDTTVSNVVKITATVPSGDTLELEEFHVEV